MGKYVGLRAASLSDVRFAVCSTVQRLVARLSSGLIYTGLLHMGESVVRGFGPEGNKKVAIHAQGMIAKGRCTDSPLYNVPGVIRAADLAGIEQMSWVIPSAFGSRLSIGCSALASQG